MSRSADKDLDAFIERRAREATRTGKDQALEEMWAASERRDRERRRRENRALWYEFHIRLSEAHARLSEEHERKALALLEDPEPARAKTNFMQAEKPHVSLRSATP